MHLTTQEVAVENLAIGMYVSRLDVPWVQTPFPIQGFFIEKQEELDLLCHYCNKVYIDSFLSKIDVNAELLLAPPPSGKKDGIDPRILRLMNEKARFKPRVENYIVSNQLRKEVKLATEMFEKVTGQMAAMFKDMLRDGYVNVTEIRKASVDLVKSVVRNPNALAWMCRISVENHALHEQAVRSAIWGLLFTRHLGLSRHDLRDVATALLLAPIGKAKLPKKLHYGQHSVEEALQYQRHIKLTLEETEKMFAASHQVNYILSSYCERHDGTGYPRNLVGNRIPFLARVAGLSDHYENLINPINGMEPLTPAEAISHLYKHRGVNFQKELVESFIQAIGIYPTGSLVKLNNNSIGVVIEQPEKSRLRPTIAILKDSKNLPLNKPKVVDLVKQPVDENGIALQIDKSLKSSYLDIDSQTLHQKIFQQKGWLSIFH